MCSVHQQFPLTDTQVCDCENSNTTTDFLFKHLFWILNTDMAEARNDGDEELPNVSITRRRDSTGRTIIIAVTIRLLI